MNEFVGMKEMYDVNVRLNSPLGIGDRQYDVNESILSFSNVEIAQFSENKRNIQARGGFNNNPLVNWEVDKEAQFALTKGVLSPTSWALLTNSELNRPICRSIQLYENVNTCYDNDYCYADLKYRPNASQILLGAQPNPEGLPLPMGRQKELMLKPLPPSKTKWIFCYDMCTGQRIRDFEIFQNRIFFKTDYKKVGVDYTFNYEDNLIVLELGKRLTNNFLKLTGKMTAKGQRSGEVSTVLLELPKIKIDSSLNFRLGSSYDNSVVSDFYFTAYPFSQSSRNEDQSIANFVFLDKELSGEYL